MDYTGLIASGVYSKDNLKPKQKAFIHGMEAAKETVENYKANFDIHIGSEIPAFQQIIDEIAEKLLDGVIEYIDSDIAETIVAFEDNNEAEKE